MAKRLVNLNDSSVQMRMEMDVKQFRYFSAIIQNNILQEWIDQKKVEIIKQTMEMYISNDTKRDWVIIVASDPAYNLSYKKNKFLIVKMSHVTFIIYQTKPIEYPKVMKIENFQGINTDNIQLISEKNLLDQEHSQITRIKEYIVGLSKSPQFETEIVTKLRPFLGVVFKTGFWNIYSTKKFSGSIFQLTNERYLHFELQIENSKYQIVAFQKKGPEFNLLDQMKLKIREILSFLVLLTFFMTLIGCKESYAPDSYWGNSKAREQICQNRQEILGVCAIALFALIAQRMFKKYMEKRKKVKQQ